MEHREGLDDRQPGEEEDTAHQRCLPGRLAHVVHIGKDYLRLVAPV